MRISSPVFRNAASIPPQYTCDGIDISPPLRFEDVPVEARSLALVMDDPDSISGTWVHWLVWNIPPETEEIPEHLLPNGALEGKTSFGRVGWGGPCPHSGNHRYVFKLFALDAMLDLPLGSTRLEFEKAMEGHLIKQVDFMGIYGREH